MSVMKTSFCPPCPISRAAKGSAANDSTAPSDDTLVISTVESHITTVRIPAWGA